MAATTLTNQVPGADAQGIARLSPLRAGRDACTWLHPPRHPISADLYTMATCLRRWLKSANVQVGYSVGWQHAPWNVANERGSLREKI